MKFDFKPTNLIKAKEEIIAKHVEEDDSSSVKPDMSFMNYIKYLAGLDKDKVEEEALVISKSDLRLLTRYLPYNQYKVSMDNLFSIFQLRCNAQLCWILFREWQNAYNNLECNTFIRLKILETDGFKDVLKKNHLKVNQFQEILSASNIAIAYGKLAIILRNKRSKKFIEVLKYIGLNEYSKIYSDCLYLFYVYCKKNDYLEAGEEELLLVLRGYKNIWKKTFLINLLTEMSLSDLKSYVRLADEFLKITGENHSKEFEKFFSGVNRKIVVKYIDWLNIIKINRIFGKDERSLFWEKYHHDIVKKYSYSNSVVMEFDNYVAIEFLGQAMGPAYIYQKKYFTEELGKLFRIRSYDNQGMRSYLYNRTSYKDNAQMGLANFDGTRLVHNNPGWQTKFHKVLMRNNITYYIEL